MSRARLIHHLRLCLPVLAMVLLLTSCTLPGQNVHRPPAIGASVTNRYRNLFGELGYRSADVDAKITQAFDQIFFGDPSQQRVYFPVDRDGKQMGYILDVNFRYVHTEGMSYGMMIAAQLDRKDIFDRLWTFARTYLYNTSGKYQGYFGWRGTTEGRKIDEIPAPDGEAWITTSLFMAAGRWGNGTGIYDYQHEANALLQTMLHHERLTGEANTSMFDPETKLVYFVPDKYVGYTDPSYIVPAFYELWSRWAESDRDFWQAAAREARRYLQKTANPVTGLFPDTADFTGKPHLSPDNTGDHFSYDAWRVASNIAVDYSWFAADPWQVTQGDRYLTFFGKQALSTNITEYALNGDPVGTGSNLGLRAMTATAGLAATTTYATDAVQYLWHATPTVGRYRYYDDMLYLLALLEVSGRFRIYTPHLLG